MATFLTSNEQTTAAIVLFVLSGIYAVFGLIISIYLYGRKVVHDPDSLNRHTVIFKEDIDE